MSLKARKPSHRRPRRSHTRTVLRTGVAGGVLGTLAVTTAASSASAEEAAPAPADTVELPTLRDAVAGGAEQAVDATQHVADRYQLADAREQAAEHALRKAARHRAKVEAERARRAAAREAAAREAAAREAAADRAARDAERSTLSTASATGSVATVLNFLRAQLGKSYVLGASGPNAYDCSGLTSAAFQTVGISLPRTSQAQSTAGTPVSLDAVQPGDILYWGEAGNAYHVAVYVGDGKFIGAQNSSTGVVERDLDWDPPTGAVRVL